MPRKPNNLAAQKATIDLRREKVAVGMVAGMASRNIAKDLGINVHTVLADMRAIRLDWAENRRDRYSEMVDSISTRLEALWAPMYLKAHGGSARHAEICLGILNQMATLTGANAPVKIEVREVTTEALEAYRDELRAEAERRRELAATSIDVTPEQLT